MTLKTKRVPWLGRELHGSEGLRRFAEFRWFDTCLVAILCVMPLVMGGRYATGRFVYVCLVALLACLWCARQCRDGWGQIRLAGIEWWWLAAATLVVLQLVPLQPATLARWRPSLDQLLPVWSSEHPQHVGFTTWNTISLTPHRTRQGLVMLVAHGTFFLLLMQRLRTRDEIRWLLRWVAIATMWVAVIGLLQYLFGNGKFLWVYQNPYRSTSDVLRGTFYNENHFAHFLLLGLGPLGFWQCELRREEPWPTMSPSASIRRHNLRQFQQHSLTIGLLVVLFTLLLTRSRGAYLMLVMYGLSILWGFRNEFHHRAKSWGRVIGLAAALSAVLLIHGAGEVRHELDSLATMSIEELDQHGGRRNVWRAALAMGREFPVLGAGVGSFRDVFPHHFPEPRQHTYSYAESGYLHVFAETGWSGLTLLLGTLIWLVWRLVALARHEHHRETKELIPILLAGLGVSAAHAVFDFVWFIPSCFAMTLVYLAAAMRLFQLSPQTQHQPIKIRFCVTPATAALAATLGLAAWYGVTMSWRPLRASHWWNEHQILAQHLDQYTDDTGHDPSLQDLARLGDLASRTLQADPWHVSAAISYAACNLQIFEITQAGSSNPMALSQIRDAALASQFSSREAQRAWLEVVAEDRLRFLDAAQKAAFHAAQLSPLRGRSYLYLAELSFLRSRDPEVPAKLIEQALRVRPFDAAVLFSAGREAILAGNVERAVGLWRRAYHQDQTMRLAMTRELAPLIPAEFILEHFGPNWTQMIELYDFYQQRDNKTQAGVVGHWLIDQLMQPQDRLDTPGQSAAAPTHVWRRAYSIAVETEDLRAVELARIAVELDPRDYTMRRRFAMDLLGRGRARDALGHLQWCADRNSSDQEVVAKLRMAQLQMRTQNNEPSPHR